VGIDPHLAGSACACGNGVVRTPIVWGLVCAGVLSSCSSTASSPDAAPADSGTDASATLTAIPLQGCPFLGYTAPVSFAGQTAQLLLDTGSTTTSVGLSSCTTCKAAADLYSGTCSSTPLTETYQDGSSWTGVVCNADVSVGAEAPSVTMNFVGMQTQKGIYEDYDCQAKPISSAFNEGVLGLGPSQGNIIVGGDPSNAYMTALTQAGVANVFAVLLCSSGGQLWFGGYDPQYASGPPQYTPMAGGNEWYVGLSDIQLGTQSLGGADPKVPVDTGTDGMWIGTSAHTALVSALASNAAFTSIFGTDGATALFTNGGCRMPAGGKSEADIDAALPPLGLTFPGVGGGSFTIQLPATKSYLLLLGSTGAYCAAAGDEGKESGDGTLGGPALRANITIFDEANAQLGFAPQTFCD
jgi:hypothetical protein